MTEQEAIAIIINTIPKTCKMANGRLKGGYDDWDSQEGKAIKVAIDVFEEIQHYRALGTPEECRAAVEKQKAKKPDFEGDGYADGNLVYDTWICPCCGKHYEVDYDDYDFCPNCGQKLDWGEE